jgi:hypothetical protein
LFLDLITDYGISNEFIINKTEKRFTHIRTGNEIILAGMDDSEKIKSITGITSVWLEEATEFEESDFDQLILRVRGETNNYKQFIVSFNPIDENHWIKKKIDVIDNVSEVVTTFIDNAFIDQDYKEHLLNEVSKNKYLYNVYVLGQWGAARSGGEFYHSFDSEKHIGNCEYDPKEPVHIVFDFNVLPYCTLLVFQINGKEIRQIDEILARPPKNRTASACKMFASKYYAHTTGVFVYGDPAGKHKDTRHEKGWNDYDIIYNELDKYNPIKRVATSAPPIVVRGNFINKILSDGFDGIDIKFDKDCVETSNDLMYTRTDADGKKLKEKVKNEYGAKYEKYGHTSDCLDYFICEAFKSSFNLFTKGKKDFNYSVKTQSVSKLNY